MSRFKSISKGFWTVKLGLARDVKSPNSMSSHERPSTCHSHCFSDVHKDVDLKPKSNALEYSKVDQSTLSLPLNNIIIRGSYK